jgi:hypothetical protein
VFRFDARTRPPSSSPPADSIPHDELEARYAQNRTETAVVSPDKLTSVRAQVAVAANGRFSEKQRRANDRGAIRSVCYLPDVGRRGYQAVELTVTGDVEYRNLSPAAAELSSWLATLETSR